MRALAFVVLSILLNIARPALAQPTLWLSPGGYSLHFERGHNNSNSGVVAELAWSEQHSAIAGVFRNSQSRQSHLIAATYSPAVAQLGAGVVVKAGALVGLIDGYRLNNGRPVPMAGAQAEAGTDHVRFAAILLPPIRGTSSGAVFLTVKVRLP